MQWAVVSFNCRVQSTNLVRIATALALSTSIRVFLHRFREFLSFSCDFSRFFELAFAGFELNFLRVFPRFSERSKSMEAPAIRQRMTLSDQLSVLQTSSNLRDPLKFREDNAAASRRANGTRTLATVLEAEKNAAASSSSSSSAVSAARGGGRTLLDVIREEEDSPDGGGSSRWRDLTDRLRIRPGAAPWTAGSASTPARERSEQSGADRASESGTIRVSLMTLMELREREEEGEDERGRAAAVAEADGDDADVADEEELMVGSGERHVCCVCMVRKKGAAFIPCGHTFCRVCSRELLMDRGNCPLCNATILEVLDIF